MGLFDRFRPRFAKRYAEVGRVLAEATRAYVADVRSGTFPASEHSFAE